MTSDVEHDFMNLPAGVRMSIVTALQAAIATPTHFVSADDARDALVTIGFPESAAAAGKIARAKS